MSLSCSSSIELVPDVSNNGLIIIDFESWRPIFRQNFGVLAAYKDVSYQIEKERHRLWPKQRQETEVGKLMILLFSTSCETCNINI
jgi:Hyaluronidase